MDRRTRVAWASPPCWPTPTCASRPAGRPARISKIAAATMRRPISYVRKAGSSCLRDPESNPVLTNSGCQPREAESLRVSDRVASGTVGVAFGVAEAAVKTESATTSGAARNLTWEADLRQSCSAAIFRRSVNKKATGFRGGWKSSPSVTLFEPWQAPANRVWGAALLTARAPKRQEAGSGATSDSALCGWNPRSSSEQSSLRLPTNLRPRTPRRRPHTANRARCHCDEESPGP